MIKDISKIRKELEGYEQIELLDDLNQNCFLKYITIDNENESFKRGGQFVNFGNECIILKNKSNTFPVQTCKKNPDGSIDENYKVFFFVKEEQNTCTKEIQELKDTITYQQSIINKLSKKLEDLEIIQATVIQEKRDYEELLQQNRYNYKKICIESKEKDKKIRKYEEIIQKLTNSHSVFS
jgi:hypothetical protein